MPMGKNQATASTLKKERAKPPHQARHILSTITAATRQRLDRLDSGRCLITSEKEPTAVHIVAQRTPTKEVNYLEKMWDTSHLDLNLTNNLVTLRADWRLSYAHGDWTFVPTERILRKILKCKGSTFDKPYPGFNPDELHEYVFVPLPTLQHRRLTRFEGEGRGVTIYKRTFPKFSTLKHHAHPFYVIYNALPNLQKHCGELDDDQMGLYTLITDINASWRLRLASRPGKRHRLPDSDDDDACKHMTRAAAKRLKSNLSGAEVCQIRDKPNASKGKGRAKGHGKILPPTQPQESRDQPSHVDTPSAMLSDDEIAMWAAAVAAAGTPEVIDETVFWPEEEPVRAPIKRWDKWHVRPYKLPKQLSRFCSSDWPLYSYSYSLWMPYDGDDELFI